MTKPSIITMDLDSIAGAVEVISVGLRPSGNIHLGNLTTLAIAGLIAKKSEAEMRVTICDIDLPTVKRGEEKKSAIYFKYQQAGNITVAHQNAAPPQIFTY